MKIHFYILLNIAAYDPRIIDVVYLVIDWLINYVISAAVNRFWTVIHIIVEID